MSKKSSVQMIIESGILPSNAVAQLERHKMVPEGTSDRLGVSPVSFEQDSAAAEVFMEKLQQRLDEEDTEIRQTALEVGGEEREVNLVWGDGALDPQKRKVRVDEMGRVYLPLSALGSGSKKKVKAISFSGSKAGAIPVAFTEPRYEGNSLKHLVCTLRSTP